MTGREALKSLNLCYNALAESSANVDQRLAFCYAAGEALRKIEELDPEITEQEFEQVVIDGTVPVGVIQKLNLGAKTGG